MHGWIYKNFAKCYKWLEYCALLKERRKKEKEGSGIRTQDLLILDVCMCGDQLGWLSSSEKGGRPDLLVWSPEGRAFGAMAHRGFLLATGTSSGACCGYQEPAGVRKLVWVHTRRGGRVQRHGCAGNSRTSSSLPWSWWRRAKVGQRARGRARACTGVCAGVGSRRSPSSVHETERTEAPRFIPFFKHGESTERANLTWRKRVLQDEISGGKKAGICEGSPRSCRTRGGGPGGDGDDGRKHWTWRCFGSEKKMKQRSRRRLRSPCGSARGRGRLRSTGRCSRWPQMEEGGS